MSAKDDRALLKELVGVLLSVEKCSRCAHPIDEEAFDDCHRGRLEKALLSAKRHLEATEPKNLPN